MSVFRWIIGVMSALFAAGAVLSFVVYIAADMELWLGRARNCRRWLSALLLLWFNVEIWRHVVLVFIRG